MARDEVRPLHLMAESDATWGLGVVLKVELTFPSAGVGSQLYATLRFRV